VAGAIDFGTTDLVEGVGAADVVVLATPVRTILRLLPEVGQRARPGALVMDLGSSKAQICAAMGELPAHLQPVGGHPMCGKETAGFAAADAKLFRGRPFVLCPLPRTASAALEQARWLAEVTDARPVILDPELHDRAVAAISHLPYVVATALVRAVDAAGDATGRSLASSGFRDTSRLASSDVEMMLDILLTNREAILSWIDTFSRHLADLRAALATEDEPALRTALSTARECRDEISKVAGW
jgi:prephenate dehydrogenase